MVPDLLRRALKMLQAQESITQSTRSKKALNTLLELSVKIELKELQDQETMSTLRKKVKE